MNTAAKPSILLVDDEKFICSALHRTFKQHNYQVFEASSGSQALDILKNNPIDVVLSDQRMPEMTGTELLSIVKDYYPRTGRIILSGHSDMNDMADAINKANIHRFIPKPWKDDDLLQTVKRTMPKHKTPGLPTLPLQAKLPGHKNIATIEDAFVSKQIDLEQAIKNDELSLKQHDYARSPVNQQMSFLNINWPKFLRFEHEGIINIAEQSGYSNDLFVWYLINSIEYIESKNDDNKLIIDLFTESCIRHPLLKKLIRKLIETKPDIIFRLPFESLRKEYITDLLMEIYRENSSLLLNIGKRVIDIDELQSTPVRYIEMDGRPISINNHLLTEKRIKMLRDAENSGIETILSGVEQQSQQDYAKTMGFDYY
jgi:CheY-like chemotaxis protein/EAL domain-containing protein (putative c-di-GMP-specific phosphodiesterase class I)